MKINEFLQLIKSAVLFCLFFTCALITGFAQTFTFKSSEESNLHTARHIYQHTLPDTITTWCHDWTDISNNPTTWTNEFKYKSNHSLIKMSIDNLYPKLQYEYTYQITYKIYGYPDPADTVTHFTIIYDTLTVSNVHYTDCHNAYQDVNVAKYSNFYKTMVIITGVWDVSSPIPSAAILGDSMRWNYTIENTILTQKYDKRHLGTTYYGSGASSTLEITEDDHHTENYLGLYFGFTAPSTAPLVLTPVNYELEWTYVDDYKRDVATGAASHASISDLNYDFTHNCTRVWLTENNYKIPLLYPNGYLLYRVRMVRPDSNQYKYPIYGDWSYSMADAGPIGAAHSNSYYYIGDAYMHDSINWQYTINFAEGGKYKQVVSFYDGMLKNRESVTRFNSDLSKLIVGKSIYDFEGHPAINILPTPVPSSSFNFVHDIDNNSVTGLPYKADDFDTGCLSCPVDARLSPLAPAALANVYYSGLNPDTTGFQKYVPDAEGFPMTQTVFSPAYSNRIDKQGGAGPRLQIADSNIITNFYAGIEQKPLDVLFGLNIGRRPFYRRVITKDPNMQLSMSISDYKGRQVVSGLIGRGGNPVTHPIVPIDAPDSTCYNEDILKALTQLHLGNKTIADYPLFNPADGNVTLQYLYHFRPYPVCDQFLGLAAHYFYTLTDKCGDTVIAQDSTIGVSGLVTTPYDYTGSVETANLTLGNYDLHKELSIDFGDVENVLDSFFNGDNCLLTQPTFLRNRTEAEQFPCEAPTRNPCEQKKWEMMQELHPGAKYGQYMGTGSSITGASNSIFTKYSVSIVGQPKYIYRYQDSCTAFSLPDTITIDGVFYDNLRTMAIDSFIMLYNLTITPTRDPIAEALLPLHPEYCKLKQCFVDTFREQLLVLPDATVAEQMHLLLMDSIIAHDPIQHYLLSYGFTNPYDSLATYSGGVIPLDVLVLEKAYCGCGDSIMSNYCIYDRFGYEIGNRLLINDFVKERYFNEVIDIYLSNRQRFIDGILYAAGDSCWHCANVRMTLQPAPIFPIGTTTAGGPAPMWADSLWTGAGHTSWLLSAFSGFSGTTFGAIMDSATLVMYDSARLIYSAGDSLMCFGQIDTIVAHLDNCGSGNPVVLSGIRNTLDSLCAAHVIHFGVFTPDMIRFAILRNGATLNDFCNPYLVSYDLHIPTVPLPSSLNCRSDSFFTTFRDYLNDTDIIAVLRNPGIVRKDTLQLLREFENNVWGYVGDANTEVFATWDPVDTLYRLFIYPDPLSSGGTDTVRIFLRGTGGCGNVFSLGDSIAIFDVSCVNTLTAPPAMGYINNYSFVTDVLSFVHGTSSMTFNVCSVLGWTDSIPTMVPRHNVIAECVPCTQMRSLYKSFRDTLQFLGVMGTDHPMYDMMLQHFVNYKLSKIYSAGQYNTFIESCSLADSMTMPMYFGYANMKFANSVDADVFIALLNALDPTISFYDMYKDSAVSGAITVSIDFNLVPYSNLWLFKDFIDNYTGSYVAKVTNSSLGTLQGSDVIGFFHIPVGTVVPPVATILGSGGSVSVVQDANIAGVWNGTLYEPRDYYYIKEVTGTTPAYEVSRALYELRRYFYNNGISSVFGTYKQSTINNDYYRPEKIDYLNYAYHYQQLPPYRVLDSLQAEYLVARIAGYAGSEASYTQPFNPNVITNLYLSNGTSLLPGFDTLRYILQTVMDSNLVSPGHVFFDTNRVQVRVDGSMYAYRCADGSYWYRYFGGGDTLYNVWVAMPPWIPGYSRPAYTILSIGPPADITPALGDTNCRFFTLNVQYPGDTVIVHAKGMTSFVIAKNIELYDVLLGNQLTGINGTTMTDTFQNCERDILGSALRQGNVDYSAYYDSARSAIRSGFLAWMLDSLQEQLFVSYINQDFSYTLYYYDRAGNLISTVPPGGVKKLDTTLLDGVSTIRDTYTPDNPAYPDMTGVGGLGFIPYIPQHNKVSQYQFNSLNQVLNQNTPDGGTVTYKYDKTARLVFSQNDKQAPEGYMTYRLYDHQNRMIETGEAKFQCPYFDPFFADLIVPGSLPPCYFVYPIPPDPSGFTLPGQEYSPYSPVIRYFDTMTHDQIIAYIHTIDRRDVVVTVYDTEAVNLQNYSNLTRQENLRKRVAVVKYFEQIAGADTSQQYYTYANHYSYDIAGNVKTLVQDFPALDTVQQRYKRIDYDYDLISGKVNMLSYNRGYADQYYQKYAYDDDNRLTKTETSNDGLLWHRDAEYSYYQHGPLARLELGDLRVQGIDYAYTIQGWLKSINGDTINKALDMGQDGYATINAGDAAAFTIDYFKDDYKPIGGTTGTVLTHVTPQDLSLYNGNIARQTMAFYNEFMHPGFQRLNKQYVYDQLNRLHSTTYNTVDAAAFSLTPTESYRNHYTYDPDGNILELVRYGDKVGVAVGTPIMDSFAYYYGNTYGVRPNQLYALTDDAPYHYGNDIRYHTATTPLPAGYSYDAVGNTSKDLESGQDTIQWNLYNKVTHTRSVNDSSLLSFKYDAGGNRVAKYHTLITDSNIQHTNEYYVRDASGNVLATYKEKIIADTSDIMQNRMLSLGGHDIYGSSRLGVKSYWPLQVGQQWDYAHGIYDTIRLWQKRPWYSLEYQDVIKDTAHLPYGNMITGSYLSSHITGQKQYEFTDHLGNVLATVSDARQGIGRGIPTDSFTIVDYRPVLQSESDYYPFGMLMPNRYINDVVPHSTSITATVLSPAVAPGTYYSYPGLSPSGFVGSASASSGGTYMILHTSTTGGGAVFHVGPLTPGVAQDVYITASGGTDVYKAWVNAPDAVAYAQVLIPTSATVTALHFTPTGSYIDITIDNHPGPPFPSNHINIYGFTTSAVTMVPQNVVTTIANDDQYQYGFNGQMKDNEWAGVGNYLDYGARGYDTRIARWLSKDPLFLKYHSFSPYNYAINSPILFSDKQGKEIYIADLNTGGRGVIDRVKYVPGEPYVGNSEYIRQVVNNLNILLAESKTAGEIITTLVEQKDQVHQIQNFDPSHPVGRNWYTKTGTLTSYIPNTDNGLDGQTTETAALIHELKHGYDRSLHRLRTRDIIVNGEKQFVEAEWDAVNVENQILYDEGQPLRKSYGGITIPDQEYCQPLINDTPRKTVAPMVINEDATINVIMGGGKQIITSEDKNGKTSTQTVTK